MEKITSNLKGKPLFQATLEDFWLAGIEMGIVGVGNGHNIDSYAENERSPWLVVGVKCMANVLQVSISTVNRMLAEGVIDSATFQYGKSIIFDVNAVLDILRRNKNK